MSFNRFDRKDLPVIAICAATAVLATLGFYWFPWISDDINYRMPFKDWYNNGAPINNGALWDFFVEKVNVDNGRMASLGMIYVQFLPEIILSALSGIAVYLSLWYGLKLANLRHSVPDCALWSVLFFAMMPWVDQMYVFDFQMAYLWGGAFAVVFLYQYLNLKAKPAWLAVFALIIGLWQESFGFPLFCALCVIYALYPTYRTRTSRLVMLIIFFGLAFLFFAPGGMSYRTSGWRPFAFRSNILVVFALPTIIFYIWLAILCAIKGIKKVMTPTITTLAVASVVSAALLFSQYGPRVAWCATICAGIGFMILLGKGISIMPRKLARTFSVALLAAVALHLTAVAKESHRLGKSYDYIIQSFKQEPDTVVFADMKTRAQAPLICLQKPNYGIFAHWNNIIGLSEFYRNDGKLIHAVPEVLAGYTDDKGTSISGNWAKFYSGFIVGRYISAEPARVDGSIDFGFGTKNIDFFITPFTDADGVRRAWYAPNASTLDEIMSDGIVRLELFPEENTDN